MQKLNLFYCLHIDREKKLVSVYEAFGFQFLFPSFLQYVCLLTGIACLHRFVKRKKKNKCFKNEKNWYISLNLTNSVVETFKHDLHNFICQWLCHNYRKKRMKMHEQIMLVSILLLYDMCIQEMKQTGVLRTGVNNSHMIEMTCTQRVHVKVIFNRNSPLLLL